MNPSEKPRRLGRGLEALLGALPPTHPGVEAGTPLAGARSAGPSGTDATAAPNAFRRIPIAQIRPNPFQPRREFRAAELAELEASLRTNGMLQPVTVRSAPNGSGYEIIAGERRLRAATRIGWTEIPAIVHDVDDRTAATLALVENLQRTDLNPIEEAEGYRRLVDEFSLTQQQVADVVGKDRSTVANMLRVLALPASVRRMLQAGELTIGHARALLSVGAGGEHLMVDLAREVVANGLSVRDVERRAREAAPKRAVDAPKPGRPPTRDPEERRIEDQLRRHFQTDVALHVDARQRGEIRLQFYSNDDLGRLLAMLLGAADDEL
jgi:ParB family chromosome partitioning protein